METNRAFELASRCKTRFVCNKGRLSVEDLWDLRLDDLDNIFKALNRQAKAAQEESLLGPKTRESSELDLQITIVKHIVMVKLMEIAEKESLTRKKAQRDQILKVLADKQNESLASKTIEQLTEMLDKL